MNFVPTILTRSPGRHTSRAGPLLPCPYISHLAIDTMPTQTEPKRKIKPHIRPTARKLRSKENAELICGMIEEGKSLRDAASVLGVAEGSITGWIKDDTSNGGAEIGVQYARAVEIRCERMAYELLQIADDERFMSHPELAAAMVTKQRLAVDARKWLLSKMFPRKYGDRLEVAGDTMAPLVTRIELVAVEPQPQAKVIEHEPNEGREDG